MVAFEPGTGKTYMGIARDLYIRNNIFMGGPMKTLIVGPPNSLVLAWMTHLLKLTDLRCQIINIYNKEIHLNNLDNIDIIITHWESLHRMEELTRIKWGHIIGDELHKIKNRKSKRSIIFKRIKTVFRTGLTGTPIYNKPPDLWSQYNWLDKYNHYFKSYNRFFQ